MALNSTHPEYDAHVDEWRLLRRAYQGEKEIKRFGELYLPPTAGQAMDGMDQGQPGRKSYEAYKARARFPAYVREAVQNFVGMMHQKPPTIELPTSMEGLLTKATNDGESLPALLRRINVEQMLTGRLGLLADLPAEASADTTPYLALYIAEAFVNWDESNDRIGVNALQLVVLDESGVQRNGLEWEEVERYRVLMLNDAGQYVQQQFNLQEGDSAADPDPEVMLAPSIRGKVLEQIPFVVINAQDIVVTPDQPPLLPLAEDCLGIYRGEADYRQSLHNQAQDTLVICNSGQKATDTAPGGVRVGAGAVIELESDGDAKFIGTNSEGIPEQRSALENDRKAAETRAGALISPAAGKQESGDALSTRLAAQTASLTQMALTGAIGMENALKTIAAWMGEDPEKVKVQPNLEFSPVLLSGQEVLQLVTARGMGAPLSMESIHAVMRDRGIAQFDFETEQQKISEEDMGRAELVAKLPQPPAPPAPAPGGGDE